MKHYSLYLLGFMALSAMAMLASGLGRATAQPADITGTPSFLPFISRAPATATLPPNNMVCRDSGSAQICAWVLIAYPRQDSVDAVYGRLLINGTGQAGLAMNTTWHYKTTTSNCDSTTDSYGFAWCSQSIGLAPIGFQVNIDVSINGYSATTWFTPWYPPQ